MSIYKAPDGSKYNIPTEPLQRKRFVDAVKNKYGEVFLRGNNVFYISAKTNKKQTDEK